MKILDFFLFFWVIFALLDPDLGDPATQINGDPCGIRNPGIWYKQNEFISNSPIPEKHPALGMNTIGRNPYSWPLRYNCPHPPQANLYLLHREKKD
jgi:hypothetical protein